MEIVPFHSKRGCLSYLLVDAKSHESALIDPSEEVGVEAYGKALEQAGARLHYIIETHTHADHLSIAREMQKETGAQVVRHALAPSALKDIAVFGGEELLLGTTKLSVLATPGHTNESISILADGAVFTGDALLIGGTGRTDFQLGDSEALYESLHETLGKLPDDTEVYPAHDYKERVSTTIGEEKRTNPRFGIAHEEFIAMMNAYHPPKPELFEQSIEENSK